MDSTSTNPSHGQTSQSQPVAINTGQSRSRAVCRFYNSKRGCRAGEHCQYRHVDDSRPSVPLEAPTTDAVQSGADSSEPVSTKSTTTTHVNGKQVHRMRDGFQQRAVTSKPVPQKDPRDFQIAQVTRRFSPDRKDAEETTILSFNFAPSDPDFPFELGKGLQCELNVPKGYPQVKPTLRIKNVEMPRGYQINVERGFDELVAGNPNKTLLQLLNDLDKKLEAFLTSQKAQTIKIVANAQKQTDVPLPETSTGLQPSTTQHSQIPSSSVPLASFTAEDLAVARSKREADVRQLEARMSHTPGFSRSGHSFNIPLHIPKPGRLPLSLQSLKEVFLTVPERYNLEPCTIKLKGIDDGQLIEKVFENHARDDASMTLMAHINWLTQNIHALAVTPKPVKTSPEDGRESNTQKEMEKATVQHNDAADVEQKTFQSTDPGIFDPDRPHLRIIARPPEWDMSDHSDESSGEDYESEEDSESQEEEVQEDSGVALPSTESTVSASNNSIIVSFPGIELYGIELLEMGAISLTVKCDRCKSTADVNNLKASPGSSTTSVNVSCPKCATPLTATFHAEPLHANSIKAGHLDLVACTVSDMLPSTFTPTCSECSTPFATPPGVISVRGESTLSVCRNCHKKMTFKIPEVKFLRVTSAHISGLPLRQPKKRENLGIVAGTPLPNQGACSHYRKSHRWFRFSCCNKVYPCDRCHDEKADPKHPNEHANRMICGYCSREQNYRPDDCGFCRSGLVGKRGGGFWEGGKGTRDRVKMNRKDPRKYKRRAGGGTASGKKVEKKDA